MNTMTRSAHRRTLAVTMVIGALAALTPAATGATSEPARVVVIEPSSPRACTADEIGADTDIALRPEVVCSAGFAMALRRDPDPAATTTTGVTTTTIETTSCARVDQCAFAEVFHVTTSGWVHDGRHNRECAEDLGVAFISPQAAAALAPVCNASAWPAPPALATGDRGIEVMYVQIALVGLGFDMAVDGTFGSATEAALTAFQTANSLAADGVATPETHAALGTGPNPPLPTTTTTAPPITLVPGAPPACTPEAISADVGMTVGSLWQVCHAGWAIGMLTTSCRPIPDDPEIDCEAADMFHLTDGGWVYDGLMYPYCAEILAQDPGMSMYTGLAFSPICDEGASVPPRTNIVPGSSGPRVTHLQIALVALGYPIAVDGEYGPRTEAAVRDFQSRNGLDVDGIAGPNTQERLEI